MDSYVTSTAASAFALHQHPKSDLNLEMTRSFNYGNINSSGVSIGVSIITFYSSPPPRGRGRVPHVTVSNAYSSPTLIPPWNTVAPGLAGVVLANRRHLFSVEGVLPEMLNGIEGCAGA